MSDTKSLFNDEPDEDFLPANDRPNPLVWIRRLVLVEQLNPDVKPLREVEFRRGLNIVATARPDDVTDGPVGHNVGKTLLTRLLRYCLGEQYFARETVRAAIGRALSAAHVICEICVDGTWWVVSRPIGVDRATTARCLASDSWRSILTENANTERFSRFSEVLDQVTIARYSETTLPHANRPVRWIELLAWLSRDQYCRYRHPLEWRATWTESGTADLHNEDASVLIRLVMDMLDDEEGKLIQLHKQLLDSKKATMSEVERIERRLAQARGFLQERLNMESEALSDDLFGGIAREKAKQLVKDLQQKLVELDDDRDWQALLDEVDQAKHAVARKEQEIATRQADRQTAEGEKKQQESASSDDLAQSLSVLANPCPSAAEDCIFKRSTGKPGEVDPLRQMRIEELTRHLQRLDQAIAGLQSELEALKECRDEALEKLRNLSNLRRDTERRFRRDLSVAEAQVQEAEMYVASLTDIQKATGSLARIERKIEESRNTQSSARELIASRTKFLNRHFSRALHSLIAQSVDGEIKLDMRGLHLSFGDESSLGEALATSERVLSLDIACLSAAICGLGFLPRFTIHDSPREADLEPHIYARLFRYLKSLEDAFGDCEPSFQYIVTTTTPPPAELNRRPFLRLELDGRSIDGLLLRKRF